MKKIANFINMTVENYEDKKEALKRRIKED